MMNLVENPWIPVQYRDKKTTEKASLKEVFDKGDQIADLAVSPIQRIALMRLLICITQAALDGPEDEKDWLECRDRIKPGALKYLEEKKDCFDLYGPRAFMQISELDVNTKKEKTVITLDPGSGGGSYNGPLFDHDSANKGYEENHAWKAISLLVFLNFCPSGKIGQSKWQGQQISSSTFITPCHGYLHTYLISSDLISTIHLNLVSKKSIHHIPNVSWGVPAWEKHPSGPKDSQAFTNISKTYLGRLVPVSRLIRLDFNGEDTSAVIIGPVPSEYKIEGLPSFREPSATVIKSKKEDLLYLRLPMGKHVWRELGSILTFSMDSVFNSGPLPLTNFATLKEHVEVNDVEIWSGQLLKGANEAKIADEMEWKLTIPKELINDVMLEKYQNGCTLADSGRNCMAGAVKTYASQLKIDKPPYNKAELIFWSILDKEYHILIETASDISISLNEKWYPIIGDAMREAYQVVCTHTTPRQIQAYAKGKEKLRLKKPEE